MDLRSLNFKYALVSIGFMLVGSGCIGFAYNYLSQSGFDDGTVETVMSLISLLGIILGPAADDLIDRSQRITQAGRRGRSKQRAGGIRYRWDRWGVACKLYRRMDVYVPRRKTGAHRWSGGIRSWNGGDARRVAE